MPGVVKLVAQLLVREQSVDQKFNREAANRLVGVGSSHQQCLAPTLADGDQLDGFAIPTLSDSSDLDQRIMARLKSRCAGVHFINCWQL